jgi:hypothetical protein
MPPLSHLPSCTPTKSNLYLANSLAAAVSEPALYRLLTSQVPNLVSLFRCVGRSKVSVQVRGFVCEYFVTKIHFHGEELLSPCPTPQAGGPPLVGFRDCLFSIFAAALQIGGLSSIRNLRTFHTLVTGTHLSHGKFGTRIKKMQIFLQAYIRAKYFVKSTFRNMATMQNFKFISKKYNVEAEVTALTF